MMVVPGSNPVLVVHSLLGIMKRMNAVSATAPVEYQNYISTSDGYFNAFCSRIKQYLGDDIHFAFSSTFSIDPDQTDDMMTNPHVMLRDEGDWYCPEVTQSQTEEEEVPKLNSNQMSLD